MTPEDVKDSQKSLAASRNFLFVGEALFSEGVQAITGKPYRHIAFMPCRIAVVENMQGKIWLYSMNLDMLIHGGRMLPSDLRKEAIRIRNVVREIMESVAASEF